MSRCVMHLFLDLAHVCNKNCVHCLAHYTCSQEVADSVSCCKSGTNCNLILAAIDIVHQRSEMDSGMFSMFGQTGGPIKRRHRMSDSSTTSLAWGGALYAILQNRKYF